MILTQLKIINFSHEYQKLFNINHEEPVTLLEVFQKDTKNLSLDFIMYDTEFICNHAIGNFREYYPLKKGEHLVLLFADSLGQIFTTIRSRFNKQGDKLPYYLNARGEKFKVIFKIENN